MWGRTLSALWMSTYLAIAGADLVEAQAPPQTQMQFRAQPPSPIDLAVMGTNGWRIFASGPIDDDAPRRLAALIRLNNIPQYSTVYFDSPGGSLSAGMSLGRIIRSAGFDTNIAGYGGGYAKYVAAGCYSACTLAFLGGKWRYASPGAVYGVHRFYTSQEPANGTDLAQQASALVVSYIRELGVDPGLFSLMTLSGRNDITVLTDAQLTGLNVVNNGVTPTVWTIESGGNILYLKGERDTSHGINKFILGCADRDMVLTIFFDAQGHEGEVPLMKDISLVLDRQVEPIRLVALEPPAPATRWIMASFVLPPMLVTKLRNAQRVGVMFQYGRGAANFLGFVNMDFADGAAKMPAVLRGCLPS